MNYEPFITLDAKEEPLTEEDILTYCKKENLLPVADNGKEFFITPLDEEFGEDDSIEVPTELAKRLIKEGKLLRELNMVGGCVLYYSIVAI